MKRLVAIFLSVWLFTSAVWAGGFELESPDIHGQLSLAQVYDGFGCRGENISPLLMLSLIHI